MRVLKNPKEIITRGILLRLALTLISWAAIKLDSTKRKNLKIKIKFRNLMMKMNLLREVLNPRIKFSSLTVSLRQILLIKDLALASKRYCYHMVISFEKSMISPKRSMSLYKDITHQQTQFQYLQLNSKSHSILKN
jgi:hypothetical protein